MGTGSAPTSVEDSLRELDKVVPQSDLIYLESLFSADAEGAIAQLRAMCNLTTTAIRERSREATTTRDAALASIREDVGRADQSLSETEGVFKGAMREVSDLSEHLNSTWDAVSVNTRSQTIRQNIVRVIEVLRAGASAGNVELFKEGKVVEDASAYIPLFNGGGEHSLPIKVRMEAAAVQLKVILSGLEPVKRMVSNALTAKRGRLRVDESSRIASDERFISVMGEAEQKLPELIDLEAVLPIRGLCNGALQDIRNAAIRFDHRQAFQDEIRRQLNAGLAQMKETLKRFDIPIETVFLGGDRGEEASGAVEPVVEESSRPTS